MSIATIVSLVVNILFALVLVCGFFIGVKRGWKRATLRVGIVLVVVVIVSFVSPFITKALFNINIGGSSIFQTIKSTLTEGEGAHFIAENPSMLEFVEAAMVTLVNLVVFIVANILLSLISYFIYLIIGAICFRKERKAKKQLKKEQKKFKKQQKQLKKQSTANAETFEQTQVQVVVKTKDKTKWIGGAVGFVHAFIMLFVVFLPISGIVGTYDGIMSASASLQSSDLADNPQTTLSLSLSQQDAYYLEADTDATQAETLPNSLSELINDNIPSMVKDIIGAYSKSAIKATSGVFGLDIACFDSISKFNINGENVVLRKDIADLANIYNKFAPVYNKFVLAGNDISKLDFGEIAQIVDMAFELSTIKALGQELIPYLVDEFVVQNEELDLGEYTPQIKTLLSDIVEDYEQESEHIVTGIKNDIVMIINAIDVLNSSDVFVYIADGDLEKIIDCLSQSAKDGDEIVINTVIDLIFSSSRIKTIMLNGYNICFDAINDHLLDDADDKIDHFDAETFNCDSDKETLKNLFSNLINFYNSTKGEDFQEFDFDSLENAASKLFDLQFVSRAANVALPAIVQKYLIDGEMDYGDYNEEIKEIINTVAQGYKDGNAVLVIKSDISKAVDILQEIQTSQAFANLEEDDEPNIKLLFVREDGASSHFERIVELSSDKRFNKIYKTIINIAIDLINENLELEGEDAIEKLESFDIAADKADINDFMLALLELEDTDPENLTYDDIDKLEVVVDKMFNLQIAEQVAPKLLSGILQSMSTVEDDEIGTITQQIKNTISTIADSYTNVENVKNDLKALLNVYKVLIEEDLANIEIENPNGLIVELDKPSLKHSDKTKAYALIYALADSDSDNLVLLLREILNVGIDIINTSLELEGENKVQFINLSASEIKLQKDDLVGFVEHVARSYESISEGVDLEHTDLTHISNLLDYLQEKSFEITVDGDTKTLGNEKTNSVLLGIYKGLIEYFVSIENYGEKIEAIVKDGDDFVYVAWQDVFKLVTAAQSVAANGVTSENITDIIVAIKDNAQIKDEMKDIITQQFGEDASENISDIIDKVANAKDEDIEKITTSIAEINNVLTEDDVIDQQKAQEIANSVSQAISGGEPLDILSSVSEIVGTDAVIELEETQKQNVEAVIKNIAENKLKEILQDLFGLSSVNNN